MLIIVLIVLFLFFACCATVAFEHSLKKKGSLPKKIFVYIKDIVDLLFGL
jgi:hypothetical protein